MMKPCNGIKHRKLIFKAYSNEIEKLVIVSHDQSFQSEENKIFIWKKGQMMLENFDRKFLIL